MPIVAHAPLSLSCAGCGAGLPTWDAQDSIRTEGDIAFVDESAALPYDFRAPGEDLLSASDPADLSPATAYEAAAAAVRDDLDLPPDGTLIVHRRIGLLVPGWKQPHFVICYCVKVATWEPVLPQKTAAYVPGDATLVCLAMHAGEVARTSEAVRPYLFLAGPGATGGQHIPPASTMPTVVGRTGTSFATPMRS